MSVRKWRLGLIPVAAVVASLTGKPFRFMHPIIRWNRGPSVKMICIGPLCRLPV